MRKNRKDLYIGKGRVMVRVLTLTMVLSLIPVIDPGVRVSAAGNGAEEVETADTCQSYDYVKVVSGGTRTEAEGNMVPGYGVHSYAAYSVWAPKADTYQIQVAVTGTIEAAAAQVIVEGTAVEGSISDGVLSAAVQLGRGRNIIYCMDHQANVYGDIWLPDTLIPVRRDQTIAPGDVNGDEQVNVVDLVISKKLQQSIPPVSVKVVSDAVDYDYNYGGTGEAGVGAADVATLRQVLTGAADSSLYAMKIKDLPNVVLLEDGSMFTCISAAMEYIEENEGVLNNKATIRLMGDVAESKTAQIPAGCDITIMDGGVACTVSRDADNWTSTQLYTDANYDAGTASNAMNLIFYVHKGAKLTLSGHSDTENDNAPMLIVDGKKDPDKEPGYYAQLAYIISGGELTVNEGVAMQNNKANNPGSAVCTYGTLNVNGGLFTGNELAASSSSWGGGAIYVPAGGIAVIRNGKFEDNSSASLGGAICSRGELTIENTVFDKNDTDVTGGAVYLGQNSTVDIKDGTSFTNNSAASHGGAIYIHRDIAATIGALDGERITFSNNTTSGRGGAIYTVAGNEDSSGCDLTIVNTDFTANNAQIGGAVYLNTGCKMLVGQGTSFSENKALISDSYGGGAIYLNEGTSATVYGTDDHKVSFCKNESGKYGGAIYYADDSGSASTLIINYAEFIENRSSSSGGAIQTYAKNADSKIEISDCTFRANYSGAYGGALSCGSTVAGTTNVRSSIFEDNTANGGSSVTVATSCVLSLENCTVTHSENTTIKQGDIRVWGCLQVKGRTKIDEVYLNRGSAYVQTLDALESGSSLTLTPSAYAVGAKLVECADEAGAAACWDYFHVTDAEWILEVYGSDLILKESQ